MQHSRPDEQESDEEQPPNGGLRGGACLGRRQRNRHPEVPPGQRVPDPDPVADNHLGSGVVPRVDAQIR